MKRIFIVVFAFCACLMMSQPLMAENISAGRSTSATSGMKLDKNHSLEALEAIEIKFYWDHCQQSWRGADDKMWCRLESLDTWIWTTDEFAGHQMIAAAASGNWFGINVISSDGTWDHCILWNN